VIYLERFPFKTDLLLPDQFITVRVRSRRHS